MHTYYKNNLKKYKKDMRKFLSLIKNEIEEATLVPFEEILEDTWNLYETDILERLPYIGGDKVSGTNNLTGAYIFIALGEILTRKGVPLNEWGLLSTIAYRRYINKIPMLVRKLGPFLLRYQNFTLKMLKKKDVQNAANAKENPGSFETESLIEDGNIVYRNNVCPLANFAKRYGYAKYMPYICNLDYAMFKAFDLPLYRYKTCYRGDDYCDFRFIKNAKVNDDWPCHGIDNDDPLN